MKIEKIQYTARLIAKELEGMILKLHPTMSEREVTLYQNRKLLYNTLIMNSIDPLVALKIVDDYIVNLKEYGITENRAEESKELVDKFISANL